MTYYTYMHTRNDTGEVFYIGKGKGNRAWSKTRHNPHWHAIVNKHGYNVEILANWEVEKEAYDHEEFLISCFRELSSSLTNICDDWRPPKIFGPKAQAIKDKISKTRLALGLGNKGVPRPDAIRLKISASNKGKPKEQVTCPHCNLTGGLGAMKRWHFDNCSQKEKK
jgi:hypothetical protein